jgi:hypothetical protein
MSGKVMGMVKERAMEKTCKYILICMADNGNDQGENIHRSMRLLAREVGCHKRTVQEKIAHMVKIGLLVDVGKVPYGRGILRGFRIDLETLQKLFPHCHEVDDDLDPRDVAGLLEDAETAAKSGSGEAAGEGEKGGPGPSFSDPEKGGPESQKGGPGDTKGWSLGPPEPLRTVLEPSGARGGDPDGPPREPGGEPPGDPAGEGHADPSERLFENRHWKPAREHFAKACSEVLARCWWDPLVALRHDDDGTLVLDAPSPVFVKLLEQHYSRTMIWALQQAGGQRLRFVVEGLAAKVAASRKAKAEAEKTTPAKTSPRRRA